MKTKQLTLFWVALICIVFSNSTKAQQYLDLAKLFYSNTPINQFDSATNGTRIEEYGLDFTLPIKLKSGHSIVTGVYAESISTKVAPDPTSNLTSVYTINLKAGMNFQFNETWSGTFIFLPKISTDFKAIGPKDFQYGGYGLMKYSKHNFLNFKFGLYYNSELFGPFFVPILGMYYLSPNKKFETNLNLPLAADANYALINWMKIGFSFNAFVRTYHLNESYDGNPDNYLAKTTNEVFLYLQFEPTKSIIIQPKIGYSIGRNYRIYDIEDRATWGLSAFKFGDNREQLSTDFKDGMILSLRMMYRFHLE